MTQLQRLGLPLKGFDAVFGGLLPNQACYSGYSALTTLGCLVLNDINQLGLSRFDMVRLAQEGEALTSAQPVSVVHPFVALFGKADRLIRVNSHTLEYEYLSLPTPDLALLLLDASRQSSNSLTEKSGDAAFCEQTRVALNEYTLKEITATQKAYEALLKQDKEGFGQALNDVQQAILDCQTNPVDEVTFLLAAARQFHLLGARAVGMGRAGCTLNVLNQASIPAFTELATVNFRREYDRELKVHHIKLVDGASRLSF
jgi:galactokinase